MKMKKMLALLLTAGMVFSLAACGSSSSSSSSSDSSSEETTEEASTDDATEEDTAEEETTEDTSSSDTDIVVAESKIIESHDEGMGDWEDEFSDYAIDGEESYTWGFIDMGYEDTFTTKIRNTFVSYCEKYFPNVTVLEADGEMDSNIQLELAENFIAQGVDCIILDPADADGCVGIVDTCIAEGMPLVVVNSVIHTDYLENEVAYVGSSNYEAGYLQGEWLAANVDDSETVNIVYQKGADGYDHTTQRYNGIFDALDEAGYNYELLSELNSEYMRDIALTNAEDWITTYGDTVDVVACCNDESCMGSLSAYQAADLAEGITFMGIDANQDCLQEIQNGNVGCTIFQNALGQAKWSAVSAYEACVSGSTETTTFSIPFETVDATNVDEYLD